MKQTCYQWLIVGLLLCAGGSKLSAQIISQNPIGYFKIVFTPGSNLFNNPFHTGNDTLNGLFPPNVNNPIPVGTTFSLWDSTNSVFSAVSVFTNGGWSLNLELPSGRGALVVIPTNYENTISGIFTDHDGGDFSHYPTLPPVYAQDSGLYLLGDKCPLRNVGTNIFLNVFGRLPYVGEQVVQISGASTYLGNGLWDVEPTLLVGQSAFFKTIAEPPPSLSITVQNHQVIVSWPTPSSLWTLQTNSDLTTGTWGDYAGTVVNNTVTNALPVANLFFRLSHP